MNKKQKKYIEFRHYIRSKGRLGSDELKELESMGMIPLKDLQDKSYYYGICRNTRIARWVNSANCFLYIREKHKSFHMAEINHPANDNGFDLFIPLRKINEE